MVACAGAWYPRGVHHDGNGWVECSLGHRHWGVHGAAGLLLHAVDDSAVVRVLLQHRAAWSHHGDTWGLPGGARDSHEDVVSAALREAVEEAALDPALLRTRHTFVDDHGAWSYTTVYADTPRPVPTSANRESVALEWVAVDDVAARDLHPGFAATWPQVRARPVTLLVDTANVLGSRPDGWWRDRAGATTRMLRRLDSLRAAVVPGPDGSTGVIRRIVAVLEGAATAAEQPGWVEVVRTDRGGGPGGDDLLVATAAGLLEAQDTVVAVTSDRGLRDRLWDLAGGTGVPSLGSAWLGQLLPREDVC